MTYLAMAVSMWDLEEVALGTNSEVTTLTMRRVRIVLGKESVYVKGFGAHQDSHMKGNILALTKLI